MNARTIKTQIRKAGFNLSEWQVQKEYKHYSVRLIDAGLSDNERQHMSGQEVNAKAKADREQVQAMAELFGAEFEWHFTSIKVVA